MPDSAALVDKPLVLPDPNTEPWLSVPRAGSLLGLGKDASYIAVEEGVIPCLRVGSKLLRVPTARFLAEVLGMPRAGYDGTCIRADASAVKSTSRLSRVHRR
jgi:hypothetical protein